MVAVSPAAPKTAARAAAEEALLDAAERLLADAGYASITTRRLATEAGVNHGLVHYYFGSNENLLVHALERFTGRLIESESAEHDLHCFQAIRRMDEILLANFMVFHDLAREEDYDLWIGDEAWELDSYLHENPEHKHAAYA
jgi:AcrR family transcriptional regulator